jgi:uncharacterized protein DUF416
MPIIRFDEKNLVKELNMLPKSLRVAFAAACAQRLVPNYIRYAAMAKKADAAAVLQGLANVWGRLDGKPLSAGVLSKCRDACISLIPDYDEEYIDRQEIAEDAVLSVIYAIDAELSGDSRHAAGAAESVYNSLYHHITSRVDLNSDGPDTLLRVDSYPIVQAEFQRQRADMADLRGAAKNSGSERAVIARIRRRAGADSIGLFG